MQYNNWTLINKSLECHNPMSTSMNVTMWKNLWISQSDINFHDYCNVTTKLLHVTSWHILWCTSQFHINIHECQNATPTLMMSQSDITFYEYWNEISTSMNVAIWPSSTSILMAITMWHQLWWMSQCDINFVECHNVTSTWINVTISQRHYFLSHCDIYFDVCCILT